MANIGRLGFTDLLGIRGPHELIHRLAHDSLRARIVQSAVCTLGLHDWYMTVHQVADCASLLDSRGQAGKVDDAYAEPAH
jgi:hypothetical protein